MDLHPWHPRSALGPPVRRGPGGGRVRGAPGPEGGPRHQPARVRPNPSPRGAPSRPAQLHSRARRRLRGGQPPRRHGERGGAGRAAVLDAESNPAAPHGNSRPHDDGRSPRPEQPAERPDRPH